MMWSGHSALLLSLLTHTLSPSILHVIAQLTTKQMDLAYNWLHINNRIRLITQHTKQLQICHHS